jgi:hypothetical protein
MTTTVNTAKLSLADREAVKQAIATIRTTLPFLIDLEADDRKTLAKMGNKSRAFVDQALEIALANPEVLPRAFDIDDMEQRIALLDTLTPLLLSLNQLQDMLDDTCLALRSEVYAAALTVYKHAKINGQGSGLETTLSDMGQRFRKSSRTQTKIQTTVAAE